MIKEMINRNMPNNRPELAFIVDNVGKILFKDEWDFIKPEVIKRERCEIARGITFKIITDVLRHKDREDLLNYLFVQSLEKFNKF